MNRLFISYRRSDTAVEAHVLKVLLEERIRDLAVFIDTDDIPGGTQWPERLRSELERSAAVIALIGPHWRGPVDAPNRLDDDRDWVRQELETSLLTKPGALLPVVVGNARDQFDALPARIADLAGLQYKPLTADRWADDVNNIAIWVAAVLGAVTKPRGEAFPTPNEVKRLFPALTPTDIDRLLSSDRLSGWSTRSVVLSNMVEVGHELYKVFELKNFKRAFHFMSLVATMAEQLHHHPDWRNVWNRIYVSQRTWDAGHVITVVDFQLAAFMNQAEIRAAAVDVVPWPS